MSVNVQSLGQVAAEFMEVLERDFSEYPDAKLGDIVLCAEISYTDEEGDKRVEGATASTTDNRIHQLGIVTWCADIIGDTGEVMDHGGEN